MNPYYDSDKLGWEPIVFNEDGLYHEFNTLCFWLTPEGEVYSASDAGCSCPTPFEGYTGETADEIKQKLERIEHVDQAESKAKAWNARTNSIGRVSQDNLRRGLDRIQEWLKQEGSL